MGFGAIMIYKIDNNESTDIGYYEISSNHFDINNFYMCINRKTKIIKFFAKKNLMKRLFAQLITIKMKNWEFYLVYQPKFLA